MTGYKVGDVVRVIDPFYSLRVGKIFEVCEVRENGVLVNDDEQDKLFFYNESIELVGRSYKMGEEEIIKNADLIIKFADENVGADKPSKESKESSVRRDCLEEAIRCVCSDRNNQYGEPENAFTRVANLWEVYTGYNYTAEDVAIMLALLKIGRIKDGVYKADNYIDLAGYAACAMECCVNEVETENDR
jgi:hypothetical protein